MNWLFTEAMTLWRKQFFCIGKLVYHCVLFSARLLLSMIAIAKVQERHIVIYSPTYFCVEIQFSGSSRLGGALWCLQHCGSYTGI